MAERKCGACRQPGHTRATCPVAAHVHIFEEVDDGNGHSGSVCICGEREPEQSQSDRVAESGGIDFTTPIHLGAQPGPWFDAQFPGICERGGEGFEAGEEIRADGEGGYECRECVNDDERTIRAMENPPSRPVALPAEPPAAPAPAPAIDAFMAPAPVETVAPTEDGRRTDSKGHRIKDPVLGDFRRFKNGNIKSVRRVTTFNKAVADTKNLTGWMKRNVLLGAAARPDIVAKAHGMSHDDNRDELNAMVKALEEQAGSKVAADIGTLIHKLTERFDQGESIESFPPQFRPYITLYRDALRVAGLVPVAMEQTTFVAEWGGVAGSFDRIYRHIASGQYFIGDVKTGKSMGWGWDEIECQEGIYAKGYNRHGTYDWDTETWMPPKYWVSESVGIVIHLPHKGEHAGSCSVLAADLGRGWDYAAVCGAVWAARGRKAAPIPWDRQVDALELHTQELPWDAKFSGVTSSADAGRLWEEARAAGVEPAELQRLVRLAQDTLRAMS